MEDKWLKGPGFKLSARETRRGCKGDLFGGIVLVGYRGCRRTVSYRRGKKKKQNFGQKATCLDPVYISYGLIINLER